MNRQLASLLLVFFILGASSIPLVANPIPSQAAPVDRQAKTDEPPTPESPPLPELGIDSPDIVGGQPADHGEYPWQAKLYINYPDPPITTNCGGSLIHPQWVLTAAHCLYDENENPVPSPSNIRIVMGEWNLGTSDGSEQVRSVTQVIEHPEFRSMITEGFPPAKYAINDLALLRLDIPVELDQYVSTIAIGHDASIAAGTMATVTGWGITSEGGSGSDILMEVGIPVVSNLDCQAAYAGYLTVMDSMLCAGYELGGKSACKGDSGGPVVVRNGVGGSVQAGIVSFARGCARPNTPGVYTRVSSYTSWIRAYVQPLAVPAVTFYRDRDTQGYLAEASQSGNYNMESVSNDAASSIWLKPDWSVMVYEHVSQQGGKKCFTSSDYDLSNDYFDNGVLANDKISSFTLYHNPVCGSDPPASALRIVEALTLSTTTPQVGQDVTARFKIKNTGGQAITVQELTTGARLGSDWSGTWADFPHVGPFVLQPNEEYTYQQTQSFSTAGNYFAEVTAKIDDAWGGIEPYARINFTVGSFPTDQVRLYREINFGGAPEWSGGVGFFNEPNAQSFSMWIPSGWSVWTYRGDDKQGQSPRCWNTPVPNLQDHENWQQNIQSIEVFNTNVCPPAPGTTWDAKFWRQADCYLDHSQCIDSSRTHQMPLNVPGTIDGKNYIIKEDWEQRSPGGSTPEDNWSGKFVTTINFPRGYYVFYADHDDGLKLKIGGDEYQTGDHWGTNERMCATHEGWYLDGATQIEAYLHEGGGDAMVQIWWSTDVSPCSVPAAPTLSLPTNGASITDTTPDFDWLPVPGATQYRIEVDDDPGFPDPKAIRSEVYSDTYTPSTPLSYGTYYWRVQAKNQHENWGDWSQIWSFTIQQQCYALNTQMSPIGSGTFMHSHMLGNCPWHSLQYLPGTVVRLFANPHTGFSFANWSGDASGSSSPVTITMDRDKSVTANLRVSGPNLLTNGDFENGTGAPSGWATDAWASGRSTFTWDPQPAGHSWGSRSVKIQSSQPNDARWTQTVDVVPNSDYRLSGCIKTEDVGHTVDSVDAGANLSILGGWTGSAAVIGTNDWSCVDLPFNSEANTQVTVAARLGFYSGTTTGTAWFDYLRLEGPALCYTLGLQWSPVSSGTISANPQPNCPGDDTKYIAGTSVQLTASPNSGYTFANWSGDASGSVNPITVSMNSDKSVMANFSQVPPDVILSDVRLDGTIGVPGEQDSYRFDADGPRWISVRMLGSGTLDPYLTLKDSSGQVLASDDNGGQIGSAAFFTYQLPARGTYQIIASGAGWSTGNYRLALGAYARRAGFADVNDDCAVNAFDILTILYCWGPTYGECTRADIDLDGSVGGVDVLKVFDLWGTSCPVATSDTIGLTITPAFRFASVGEILTVTPHVVAGQQQVEAADAVIAFDPQFLRVVDSNGQEASTIEAGSALDTVLRNTVDNSTGRVEYSAAQLAGEAPSDQFDLGVVRFKLVAAPPAGTQIRYLAGTDASYQAESVLGRLQTGMVLVPEHTNYLPLVLR